ncbi:MAG: hypothetical protein N3E37_00550 [Candidatus Micrarchaeota archaeon]|nr:hypothetical protein [Candidatus Micrarchaeota archaeon]
MISIVLTIRNDSTNTIDTELTINNLHEENIKTLDMLLRSKGIPYNWHNNISNIKNYTEIGLVSEHNIINRAKIEKFCEANYSDLKDILGKTYDFYLQIINNENSLLYECGKRINLSMIKFSVANSRFAILDNMIVKIVVVSYVEN